MDVKPLLQFQLNGSFNLLGELAEGASDEEWRSRAHPDANLVGFTVWHCARTIDWAINAVLRGSSELVEDAGWSRVCAPAARFGAGASKAEADAVANEVSREGTVAYLTALKAAALDWLSSTPAEDLDRPIDLKARLVGHPEYLGAEVWEEIADLDGIPSWQFLARPAISHIRVHYGEVRAQLEAMRASARA